MTFYGIATEDLTDGFNVIEAGQCVTVTLLDGDAWTAEQYRVTDNTTTVWLKASERLMVDAA